MDTLAGALTRSPLRRLGLVALLTGTLFLVCLAIAFAAANV
jgi:hypothetical protein